MLNRFMRQAPHAAPPAAALPHTPLPALPTPANANRAEDEALQLKIKLHRRLIEETDLAAFERMTPEETRRAVAGLVRQIVSEERLALNVAETEALAEDVLNEMQGLGPLEALLKDDTVNDILINTHRNVYVERAGRLEPTMVRFADEAHLLRIINRIVAGVGRRVDESQPMVDARLPDGSRVNAVVSPVAVDGALVSIRKFSRLPFSLDRLVENGSLPNQVARFLALAVRTRVSMIISGGTGSGKTTLLNALSAAIDPAERLVTIEDAAELQLQQPHVARMETRPPNIEGRGEIRQRELVKNALRMRPDRIIIGECRGDEAFDMLQAMNTGHEGSLSTVHANTPRDAILRLEQMVAMASMGLPPRAVRQQIASAVRLVAQVQRFQDGRRRLVSVSEIVGMEEDVIQMQEIFRFRPSGVSPQGEVLGRYEATGMRPYCLDWMNARGAAVGPDTFAPGPVE